MNIQYLNEHKQTKISAYVLVLILIGVIFSYKVSQKLPLPYSLKKQMW